MSSSAAQEILPEVQVCPPQAVGPFWPTAVICLSFAGYSTLSTIHRLFVPDAGDVLPHALIYLSQILWTWLLLAATLAAVYHRRTFLRQSLLSGARSWGVEFVRGVAVFVIFWFGAALARNLFRIASQKLLVFDFLNRLIDSTNHWLGVQHKSVLRVGPTSASDLLLWVFVSLSAGICEELIFRGYLLRQCIAFLRKFTLSQNVSIVLAIGLTSLLFGAAHLYQGVGSALTIGFLGAAYALAALRFGNLRAVIIAHSVQDLTFGIVTYLNHLLISSSR